MNVFRLDVSIEVPRYSGQTSRWALLLDDGGNVVASSPISLNKRSRGLHEPGSGNYTNQWVFAHWGDVYVTSYGDLPSSYSGSGSDWPDHAYSQLWVCEAGVNRQYCLYQFFSDRERTAFTVQAHGWLLPPRISPLPTPRKYRVRIALRRANITQVFRAKDYPDAESARAAAEEYYHTLIAQGRMAYDICPWPVTGAYLYYLDGYTLRPGDVPRFSLIAERFDDAIDLAIDAGAGVQSLIANAYVDAVNHLPDLSGMGNAVNAVQLVQSGIGLLRGLLSRRVGVVAGSVSDAWLAYRYAYSTTKADLLEISSYLSRAADLLDAKSVRCHGTYTHQTPNGDVWIAKCTIGMGLSALSSLKSTIERYGLQLDGFALWDLVPYSFVVDWFLDIGSALEQARSVNFARRLDEKCWCSVERTFVNEYGFDEIYYHRWYDKPYASAYSYVFHRPGGVTIVKRALDVLALLSN